MSAIEDIERLLIDAHPFCPLPGPQEQAYFSEADVLLYGGAAGGGKTALASGLALQAHQETLFIRRESKQLDGVADEMERILGTRDGLTHSGGSPGRWMTQVLGTRRKITFGSCPNKGDENRYQGRPRDLLVVDEAANMLEIQVQFLKGWVRTTDPKQRCRTLLCSNPPTSAEGEWLIRWFAPWLDPAHPDPAKPGELRWFAVIDGDHVEVPTGEHFEHDGELIIPESRTFIPARVQDNPYLMATGYVRTLQALPEPLRSQMLKGDFTAGREDDEWQVIPSDWVQKAMDRWKPREYKPIDITSMGVDPSRGGADATILAPRIGWWYDKLIELRGEDCSTGGKVAAKIVQVAGESCCPVHIDVIGIGASVQDHAEAMIGARAIPINAAAGVKAKDSSGQIKFVNVRARDWWRFRELLNPAGGANVALPPDASLKAELCSPRYYMQAGGLRIETKEDIKKRLGGSTDKADGVILAAYSTPIVQINYRSPVTRVATGSMDRNRHG